MSLFRKEVAQGRSNLGDVIIISPPSLRISSLVAMMIVIVITLFICFFSYTKKQRVSGVLMPDKGVIKIFSPQAGLIEKIFVKEGDKVKEGDTLFVISSERSSQGGAVNQENISEQIRTRLKLDRNSLKELDTAWLANKNNSQHQIKQLTEQVALQESQARNQLQLAQLLQKRVAQYQHLQSQEYVSLEQFQRIKEESLRQNGALEASRNELINSRRQLLERNNELTQLESNYQKQRNDIQVKIASAEQELTENELKREIVIRATKSGTVTALTATVGQFFDGHAPLLSIIPNNSTLMAYLYAPGSAVGFIKPQSEVWLRYPAWPWQKFGQYHGIVMSVSKVALSHNEIELFENKDANAPLYRIVVKPDSNFVNVYGEKIPLQAGMQLEADVVRENRRLYEWIFEPLLKIAPPSVAE
ncbi:HlyD family secretion protein [Atlantibacter hermannii]|uniref:HlyD family secretion protein n=1 Tax=Atlantibacter hermannii TaxID=565 RepID=UPI0028AEF39B|nr:HlyD family efflux transporter periplasmic adaptor subunit [Atlantibacter hermannii]